MSVADLHRRACELFDRHVGQIRPDQWELPTPCAGWDVRALVRHILVEELWTPPLMAGKTIAEVGDRFDGDVLGDDPVAAHDEAAQAAIDAVSAEGALERTVHLSFGDVPGEEYARQLLIDHLVHAWDLARAIGTDERLDPELVAAAAEWFRDREELYRGAGLIGPRAPIPDDADPQTALLAGFGRSSAVAARA
jgi:uncharacterized protein (TIGR03086 family)